MDKGKRTCVACGTWNSPRELDVQKPADASSPNQDLSYYAKNIKRLVLSIPFILGCLLITAGNIGSAFSDFSWLNLLDLAFAVVHIIALWLIVFEACSSKQSYSKTLVALSMFKVSAVLSLVLFSIVFGLLALAMLFAIFRGITFLFIIAIIGGIGYVLIKYYFLALLSVLKGIRLRIITNKFVPLDGLDSFLLISYILIGLSIILELFDAAGSFSPGILFAIINGIGIILCLRTLKRIDDY